MNGRVLGYIRLAITAALLAACLPSCSSMSEEAASVELVYAPPPNAVYVGWVTESTAGADVLAPGPSYKGALNRLLEKTARLGGTHLLLDPNSRDAGSWGFSQELSGRAYRVGVAPYSQMISPGL